jgi:RNA polymerase sigma-70 factor (ECF subfamily)
MRREPRTDAELLAAEGGAAFAVFVERHMRGVLSYAARRVGRDAGEDIANDVFLVAFKSRRRFRPPGSDDARPWLFGIATNLIRAHERMEQRQLRALARSGRERQSEPSLSADRDDVARLAAVLAGLRPEHRDALFLSAVAGFSHSEIGEALGVPAGTVKTWLFRARTRAATALTAEAEVER